MCLSHVRLPKYSLSIQEGGTSEDLLNDFEFRTHHHQGPPYKAPCSGKSTGEPMMPGPKLLPLKHFQPPFYSTAFFRGPTLQKSRNPPLKTPKGQEKLVL